MQGVEWDASNSTPSRHPAARAKLLSVPNFFVPHFLPASWTPAALQFIALIKRLIFEDPMANVRLEQVSRSFSQGRPALHGVSFEVNDREVVTVVGPSGCGKSTLLRLIAGLDTPTSGKVLIDGKPMDGVPARDRDIAMVFQSYALYPHMTCRENLALSLRLSGTAKPEIERRVRATADLLEIGELLTKRPRELSGGQRQRVAVGRALIRNPKVFLFDEPLSNLDAQLRERVRHELKDLFTRLQATVIYVTHDQTEAMSLADRVVILERGEVQQIGTPTELYRRPANRFVASFIGSPSMNLFSATLEQGALRLGSSLFSTCTSTNGAVVVGIRPESIRIVAGETGRILWTENLGSHILCGIRCGDVTLTALVSQTPAGDTASIDITPEDIYLFDANTGKNLNSGSAHRSGRA
jgi:ABC-type sugar transport system ATPase subunit